MINHKNKLYGFLFFGIFFLTYIGYYAILLLLFNTGMSDVTRSITMPVRVLIAAMIIILFIKNRSKLQKSSAISWFLLFTLFYLYRLFIEYTFGNNDYYLSVLEVLLFFLSFCVIPFIGITKLRIDRSNLNVIFNSFIVGGAAFSFLATFSYKKFIGEVGRLSTATAGEAVITPLALSYSSALIIGLLLFFLMTNKTSKKKKIIFFVIIAMSVVPFFLGASRGSLIALFAPFVFYVFLGKSFSFFLKSLLILTGVLISLIYLDNFLESGLIERFLGISEAVQTGSSSAIRTEIWKQSFEQFINNPILGDSLNTKNWDGYPHNIFLEVLQTTGFLGFIPFIVLIVKSLKISFKIFKEHREFIWVFVVFIQTLIRSSFSGALYNAAWFWTSMALLFAVGSYIKTIKTEKPSTSFLN